MLMLNNDGAPKHFQHVRRDLKRKITAASIASANELGSGTAPTIWANAAAPLAAMKSVLNNWKSA
jgi:hypothetical protein